MLADQMTRCPHDTSACTFATCPSRCVRIEYAPSLAGNLVYCTVLALILLGHTWRGVFYKTWGFLAGMLCGLSLEVVGYVGRVRLHSNQFSLSSFTMYLVCLTIGPAFISGSLYLCLSRIIVVYGQARSRFSPRAVAIGFMVSDFVSLLLQSAGGGVVAAANTSAKLSQGRDIMVAGLIFQVVSLAVFMALWADFAFRTFRTSESFKDPQFRDLRSRPRRFVYFQWSLRAAVVAIFIRSVFRVVELWGGFKGKVASDQTLFMIFEGPMIAVATALVLVWHPGYAFAGKWHDAAWSLRRSKGERLRDRGT